MNFCKIFFCKSGSWTRSWATAEIARDADDVDFSVDNVHSALTVAFNFFSVVSSF